MRSRLLFFAYVAASIAGVAVTVGIGTALNGPAGGGILHNVWLAGIAASIGGVLALPIALCFIISSEDRNRGRLGFFLTGGVCAGSFLVGVLAAIEWQWNTGAVFTIVPSSTMAAFTYWLIAWRLFPPKETAEERPIS